MKRTLLLILSVMAFAGMGVAQDVYTGGYHTDDSNTKQAVIHKNGNLIYESHCFNGFYAETTAVELCDGDLYSALNVYRSDGSPDHTEVLINGDDYLTVPSGNKGYINRLCHNPKSGAVYAAGYMDVGSVRSAVIWKGSNANPYYILGNGTYPSRASCVCMGDPDNETVYAAGYQYDDPNNFHGAIWKNNAEVFNLGSSVFINDIAFYDGFVYTVGTVSVGSNLIAKVWRNDAVLYTLAQTYSNGCKIYIDAGDIYVCGYEAFDLKVWKNGETLYEHPTSTNASGAILTSVMANTSGIYYTGRTEAGESCKIWKDGHVASTISSCDYVYSICVADPVCDDEDARSLPFSEDFEIGLTDWPCWTTVDVDDNNPDSHVSYWDRKGVTNTVSGDYCAMHRFNVNSQEGWLISPKLFLQPGRDYTKMTFKTMESSSYQYEGVWISTTDKALSSFHEVWTQTSPSSGWTTAEINLKEYQGETIYVAFKYKGTNGHNWYIDNIIVEEGWNPCVSSEVPYTCTFDTELGYCWYILDVDQSGGNACWAYSHNQNCVDHVWGQPGIPQEGWLISTDIILPAGQQYTLSFDSKNESSGDSMSNSVWIAIDKPGVPDLSDYTKIWADTEFPDDWKKITIPLSIYSGHSIRVAFKYEGSYAHTWLIDNFSVTEGTGLEEIGTLAMTVCPNPARESIRVEGLETESEVLVYNSLGELVKTANVNANQEIGIGELSAGLYLVRCGNATMRFVKE